MYFGAWLLPPVPHGYACVCFSVGWLVGWLVHSLMLLIYHVMISAQIDFCCFRSAIRIALAEFYKLGSF